MVAKLKKTRFWVALIWSVCYLILCLIAAWDIITMGEALGPDATGLNTVLNAVGALAKIGMLLAGFLAALIGYGVMMGLYMLIWHFVIKSAKRKEENEIIES